MKKKEKPNKIVQKAIKHKKECRFLELNELCFCLENTKKGIYKFPPGLVSSIKHSTHKRRTRWGTTRLNVDIGQAEAQANTGSRLHQGLFCEYVEELIHAIVETDVRLY